MVKDRWQPKVDALIRLAQDKGATDHERVVARLKLAEILENHPEADQIAQYGPVREFTFGDLRHMKTQGIPTTGHWEGTTLEDTLQKMVADYRRRIVEHEARPKLIGTPSVADIDRWMTEIDQELTAL